MGNIPLLKAKMKEKQKTAKDIANCAYMSKSTFYRKVQDDGMNFTVNEIDWIADTLSMTAGEVLHIFFSQFDDTGYDLQKAIREGLTSSIKDWLSQKEGG